MSEIKPTQANIKDIYPLSPIQEGMLFHAIASEDKGVYFEQYTCLIHGELNEHQFKQAWQTVIDRHDILRTLFVWEKKDKPLQVVRQQVDLPLSRFDWRGLSSSELACSLDTFLAHDRAEGFDLSIAPLMRVTLFQIDDRTHRMVWSFHHILLDGWSGPTILNELLTSYDAIQKDGEISHATITRAPIARALPRRYKDFITWIQNQNPQNSESFWRTRLAGFDSPTRLNIANRSTERGYKSHRVTLDAETSDRLRIFASSQRVTLNNLFQAAWSLVLMRYSGEDDVVFGATVSGRSISLAGVEDMVGLFINTLPIRAQSNETTTIADLVASMRAQQNEMADFEQTPLVNIQAWSDTPRGRPLFDSILAFENYPMDKVARDHALRIDDVLAKEQPHYPLVLAVMPTREIVVQISHDCAVLSGEHAAHMLDTVICALNAMTKASDSRVQTLNVQPQNERAQIAKWNNTRREYPEGETISRLFDAQATKTPQRVAVFSDEGEMTFEQIQKRANQITSLLESRGIGRGARVGVCVKRSTAVLPLLLGITKSGAAWVPMDPMYPRQRIAFIRDDADLSLIFATQNSANEHSLPPDKTLTLEHLDETLARMSNAASPPASPPTSDDVLYLLYTSGSTGTPKGVMGLHRGTLNRFRWMWESFPFDEDEVCCAKASMSFVDSIWEMFGPLLQGIPIYFADDEIVRDAGVFVEKLNRHHATRLVLVPSLMQTILDTRQFDGNFLPHLRMCVSSGEALPVELARHWINALPNCKLLNIYGSSEVSADVTWHEIKQLDENNKYVPIGKPMANTQLRILDSHLNPTPLGVTGELYVSGEHLARGYFNREDLTAERFVEIDGVRAFRSGDLARWLGGGIIEHVGRNDQQVKVRGMRVELGEIENALLKHPSVQQVSVISRIFETGDTRLVAYIVSSDNAAANANIYRDHLKSILPEFMMPSTFVILDAMPMTPSGKIDRNALSNIGLTSVVEAKNAGAPRNMLEWQLCDVWQQLLKIDNVGIHDDFFELGGHSLLAVRLFARIEKDYGVKLPVARMYAAPTVAQLAKMIDEKNGYLDWYSLVSLQMKGSKPPFFMVHGTGGCVGDFEVWSEYLGEDQPLFGLRAMGYGQQPPYERVKEMAAHYIEQMQSIVPDGPYFFGGYEAGGLVAFEMAQQLNEKSKPHAALLINTIAPDFNYREVHMNKHFVSGFVRNLPNWVSDYVRQSSQQRKIMNARMDSLKGTIETSRNLSESFHRARSKVVESVYRAFANYTAKPYDGSITLIRTSRQPLICSFDPKMGWDRLARQVDVRVVSGSISSIIGNPDHAKAFAEALRVWLSEVSSKVIKTAT